MYSIELKKTSLWLLIVDGVGIRLSLMSDLMIVLQS